jgi:RNA 2',3'-cyclic 3'-phosphodiesterase
VRTFVAIELPENLRKELARQQQVFRAVCRDARWTRPEGIHLTLKFLGENSEARAYEVTEALSALGDFEKFPVEATGFGFFPNARRPSVFWAGLDAPPALNALATRVEEAMERLGFAREQRPFNPHLTLARFKSARPQPELAALVEKQIDLRLGHFEVADFFLYESRLSPAGAEYRKVERFPARTLA